MTETEKTILRELIERAAEMDQAIYWETVTDIDDKYVEDEAITAARALLQNPVD